MGLLAYAVTAGMIEYVFIHNDTRGASLLVLSLSIVVVLADCSAAIAYTVALYVLQRLTHRSGAGRSQTGTRPAGEGRPRTIGSA